MGRFFVLVTLVALSLMAATHAFAAPLALLTHGSSGYINDAYFLQVDPENSTGTGVIQPFLRVHKNGVEEGYNTDGSTDQFPESNSPWTRSLLLTAVPLVSQLNEHGVHENYRVFLLDVNESSGGLNEFISLDELQIFLGSAGDLTNFPTGLGTMIWDMDAGTGGDTWIHLDYSLEPGSGDGDMWAYIPDRLFTGGGPYVYLYSKFGLQGGDLDASDGFEEWAVREAGPAVPEPASLAMLGMGLVGTLLSRKRR